MSGRKGRALGLALLALAGSASLAQAVSVQRDGVRISVFAQIKPFKLPREKPAPITVAVAGHLERVGGGVPPQLQRMKIEVNRHGLLQSRGLPVCPPQRLTAASSATAREQCGGALIGSGRFWAHIVLPEQGAYPTRGDLLVFNSRKRGQPALLVHIYTSNPFDSSFTITFSLKRIRGRFGTELQASLPESLGEWGYVDRIKLNLKREYTYKGRRLSYFNAACPAVKGANTAAFPLARATLSFDTTRLTTTVDKACVVKK